MPHYFRKNWEPVESTSLIRWVLPPLTLSFHTASGVFSRSRVDPGTRLLVKLVFKEPQADRFLDLACGYGPVGIALGGLRWAKRLHFCDVNFRALRLLQRNLEQNRVQGWIHCGDGAGAIGEGMFDAAGLNPPVRAGKETVLRLVHGGLACLRPQGRLYLVMRTRQGALSLPKTPSLVDVSFFELGKGAGYRVFRLEKH